MTALRQRLLWLGWPHFGCHGRSFTLTISVAVASTAPAIAMSRAHLITFFNVPQLSLPVHMPKRQFTPARNIFSLSVLPAPAPTHIHSAFALRFWVIPYSRPAPAARPRGMKVGR